MSADIKVRATAEATIKKVFDDAFVVKLVSGTVDIYPSLAKAIAAVNRSVAAAHKKVGANEILATVTSYINITDEELAPFEKDGS